MLDNTPLTINVNNLKQYYGPEQITTFVRSLPNENDNVDIILGKKEADDVIVSIMNETIQKSDNKEVKINVKEVKKPIKF